MSAENTELPALPIARRAPADAAPASRAPRGRLFRKYVLFFVGLVAVALLVNTGFDFWFGYQENKAALIGVQQEKANAAAQRIEEFVDGIERQIGWTTHAQWSAAPLDQRRFDYVRLLSQVPAITEISELDRDGKEQLKVSRLAMDAVGSGQDFSQAPAFTEARARKVWFSPVYFRKESEPYMTLALARAGRNAGVTVAEVNLKLIWDVITALKIGQGGYAYVVDAHGKLIAHPDISLVLRDTDFQRLPQVAAALSPHPGTPAVSVAPNNGGNSVLSAHATIAPLGWLVFVEVPLGEAFAPLYGAALRSAALLALGLGGATLVALFLARRMTVPIRAMQEGAAQIGAGDLDRRLDVRTGDELEALAQQFNRMAADLQTSYAELEHKVELRTAELSEALDQQTATAELLGVINSSPGDLAPVFDAMLEKAMRLCEAAFGLLMTYDGENFRATAQRGLPPRFAEYIDENPAGWTGAHRRLAEGAPLVHILDAKDDAAYPSVPSRRALVDLGGARTLLLVPLRQDERLLGSFAIYRHEVRPYTDKQIALLQNFAAQAVIAMENARLITETQEALDQQTATAEVLGVINSSPGDLAPVFDAMLEKAIRLCEGVQGTLWTFARERIVLAASRGLSPEFVELLRGTRERQDPGAQDPVRRVLSGERLIQVLDIAAESTNGPVFRAAGEFGGVRTIMVVGLFKEEIPLGAFVISRREVRPFTDKQIALLQNFAAQAVIAMENARLITETREALDQQTATAEVLGVINASPGDLAPVFEAMLEKAMRLCDAAFGVLEGYDGEGFYPTALRGVPPDYSEFLMREPLKFPPETAMGRIVAGGSLQHFVDVPADGPQDSSLIRTLQRLGGVRSAVFAPLRKDGTLLGVFVLYRREPRPFTDKQIALLENFAAQAVIAMENARLITETREALDQQTATAEVLQVINSSPGNLTPVFDAMLDRAIRLCDAAYGHFRTYDGERFPLVSVRGDPRFVELMQNRATLLPGPHHPVTHFVKGEQIIHFADAAQTDAYRNDARFRALVDSGACRALLAVALRKDGNLLGYINVYRAATGAFSEKQIGLLQNFAAQAVIAMENARLLGELRGRTDDLTESLEYQTATSDVLKVISRSTFDLQPVLETVVATAAKLCKAEKAILYRNDEGVLRYAAGFSNAVEYERIERETPIYPGEGSVAGRAALHLRTVQIVDALADPLYAAKEEARIGNARSMLGVPLLREGALVGVIALARSRVEVFADKEIELVTTFADQAVIAIENTRLLGDLREARDGAEAALGHLKAAQANLIQAEKMASLGQLTAGIAHEIKNPLNFVNNFASLSNELLVELKEIAAPALAALDDDKRAELDETMEMLSSNLDKIGEHGRRADGIVKSMLAHSRGGSGDRQVVDLNPLLEELLNLAYHGARAQDQSFNITLEREFDSALKPIELVPQDIARVFLNLFGNGFYAANKRAHANADAAFRPVLHVATHDRGDAVEITVRDNGIGIPPAIRDKLFQPFFTTKPTGEGTGLGLSISYDIVTQQHGGTIAVASEEGAFTEFTIRLPRGGRAPATEASA